MATPLKANSHLHGTSSPSRTHMSSWTLPLRLYIFNTTLAHFQANTYLVLLHTCVCNSCTEGRIVTCQTAKTAHVPYPRNWAGLLACGSF